MSAMPMKQVTQALKQVYTTKRTMMKLANQKVDLQIRPKYLTIVKLAIMVSILLIFLFFSYLGTLYPGLITKTDSEEAIISMEKKNIFQIKRD